MNLLDANDAPGAYPRSLMAAQNRPPGPLPALAGAARAQVAVVGGGYTGLAAALRLAEAGVDVVLLEAQRLGFGASGRNGGQLGTGFNRGPDDLAAQLGEDRARALWHLALEARDWTIRTLRAHAPEARFTHGVIHADRFAREVGASHAEAERLARHWGYEAIEPLDRDALRAIVLSRSYAGGTLDHGAGHLDPLAYAFGLARAARAAGARLHEGTRVTRLVPGPRVRLETPRGHVEAEHVILACNGYLGDLEPQVAARVMPINNFVVATAPLPEGGREVLARPVAVADSRFVVNYFRPTADGRLVFGGGESYGWNFPGDIRAKVAPRLRAIFPQIADAPLTHAWGGTLAITMSRLPCVARPHDNVLSVSGYSGQGVALAGFSGLLMADAVLGRAAGFDLAAHLPSPAFPGGLRGRRALLALAMSWYAMRDRLGL